MNPSIRRLIEAAKAAKAGEKPGKQKQVKPDPTSVKLVLDAPDDNEHATDQKAIPKSVAEAKAEVAVVAFGRLNPPTIGHEKMIQKMAAIAKQHGTKAKLYLSQTQDAKSNPLNYATKIKLASKAFGKHVDVVNDPSVKTFFDLPRALNGSAQHLIVVAGSDRLPEYKKKLDAYNGKEYTFEKIEVASAGERDPDADGAEGMSASKARALAREGDVEAFKKALPTPLQGDAQSIMDAIRKGMKIMNEETNMASRVAKMVKRTYRSVTDRIPPAHVFDPRRGEIPVATGQLSKKTIHHIDGDRTKAGFNKADLIKKHGSGDVVSEPVSKDISIRRSKAGALTATLKADVSFDGTHSLDEVLTLQARMKRKMAMARLKTVMKAARKRALRKRADTPTLERRARKRARDLIRQRILKTVNYADLPMSARARVDAQVAKRKKAIARISMKMLPKLKRAEMSRKLGTTARIPATGGPKPTTESVAAMAIRNFLSEGASAPQSARLISLAAVPAYEAWCMTRGSRMSKQQREAIREGLTGTVVAPGKRAGEWIVESTAGQFLIPEYLADEAALVAATSHLRITH